MPTPVVVDPRRAAALVAVPGVCPLLPPPGPGHAAVSLHRSTWPVPGVGRRRWWRRALVGDGLPIAALSALSAVATVASPLLIEQPLLLVALTPRLPFLLLASATTSLPGFLLVAGVRLCVADVSWYRIGCRLGPSVLERFPRCSRRLLTRAPRSRDLALAAAVLVRPIGRHLALSGAFGAPPVRTAVLDVVGTLGFLVALHVGATSLVG